MDQGPDNWTPYNNHIEFELADFLFCHNQMSAGNINTILNLWAVSLAAHDDTPPFPNSADMYSTINTTPLCSVPRQSFTLQLKGAESSGEVPAWIKVEYEVWFWDPPTLVLNLLSNPDFESGSNYAPYQELTQDELCQFCDFMSGIWAWTQGVCFHMFIF